jgi:predicted GIY-YIG superfamily endonuclease
MNRYFCYILKNRMPHEIGKTYNGFTVNLEKRIRQHNGEIVGGAKFTRNNGGKTWHYYAIVTGFQDSNSALSCEWWIKKPTGARRRPLKYCGPRGRVLGLQRVLEEHRFKGYSPNILYTVWINKAYLNCLNPSKLSKNISIRCFEDFKEINAFYVKEQLTLAKEKETALQESAQIKKDTKDCSEGLVKPKIIIRLKEKPTQEAATRQSLGAPGPAPHGDGTGDLVVSNVTTAQTTVP